MKKHYEGSIAPLGTEDWSEPCDAFAATSEIAAKQVVEYNLQQGEIAEDKIVNICVREITKEGDPVSDWEYLTGRAWVKYGSEITSIPIANVQGHVRREELQPDQTPSTASHVLPCSGSSSLKGGAVPEEDILGSIKLAEGVTLIQHLRPDLTAQEKKEVRKQWMEDAERKGGAENYIRKMPQYGLKAHPADECASESVLPNVLTGDPKQ